MTYTRAKAKQITYKSDATGSSVRNLHDKLGETVSVKDFGAVGDNVVDDTAAIQAAIDAVSLTGGIVYIPVGTYKISSTINIPVDVHIYGTGFNSKLAVQSGGTYTSNFAFLINTTNGVDAIVPVANQRSPVIKDLNIYSLSEPSAYKCFGMSGSVTFERIFFRFFDQSIVASPEYNDVILINKCHFQRSTVDTNYQVDIGATGDCVVIKQCMFDNVGNTPATPLKSIKIQNCLSRIEDCLVGDIYIYAVASGVTINNCGADGGKTIVEQSNVKIVDCAYSCLETEAAIKMVNSTGLPYSCHIDNCAFSHDITRDEYEPTLYDIQTANNYTVYINGIERRILFTGSPANRYKMAPLIKNEAGSSLSSFNSFPYLLSQRCTISAETVINSPIDITASTGTFNSMGAAYTTANAVWDGASGTYYYKLILLMDSTRLIGRSDSAAETSIAVTNGGNAVGLPVSSGGFPLPRRVRVYRGTSTGSYDKFADLDLIDCPSLFDTGNQINGTTWTNRGAAGVDTFNNYTSTGFEYRNNLMDFSAAGAPTSGTWNFRDKVTNRNPSVDGNNMILKEWFCTAGGTPGTWVAQYVSTVSPAT